MTIKYGSEPVNRAELPDMPLSVKDREANAREFEKSERGRAIPPDIRTKAIAWIKLGYMVFTETETECRVRLTKEGFDMENKRARHRGKVILETND